MRFKIVVLLQLCSFITFAQETLCYLKDLAIVQAETKNAINCGNADFTKETIISTFGEPTSINIEEVEAAGGIIETIRYDQNYFYTAKEKKARSGFRITSSSFFVILNDSLEIKIGEDIEKLTEVFCKKRHFQNIYVGNSRFGISYIGYFKIPFSYTTGGNRIETDTKLTITYAPQTSKIIEIGKSDTN